MQTSKLEKYNGQLTEVIIGSRYLTLLAAANHESFIDYPVHQDSDWSPPIQMGSPENFSAPSKEDIADAKAEADELIQMCRMLGYKVDNLRTKRSRWPRYGDIVSLPRDWITDRFSTGDPLEDRPTAGSYVHLDDDRWYDNHASHEHSYCRTRDGKFISTSFQREFVERLSFYDFYVEQADRVARRADACNCGKFKATMDLLKEYADDPPEPWMARIQMSKDFIKAAALEGYKQQEAFDYFISLYKGWFKLSPNRRGTITSDNRMLWAMRRVYVYHTKSDRERIDDLGY